MNIYKLGISKKDDSNRRKAAFDGHFGVIVESKDEYSIQRAVELAQIAKKIECDFEGMLKPRLLIPRSEISN